MKLRMNGGSVTIDGRKFTGNNVTIDGNGKVIIDGKVQDGELVGEIHVSVNGDVETVENTNGSVTCNSAGRVQTTNGRVQVKGDVTGDIKTTNGDVTANQVHGKVSTVNGDISH